MADRLIMTCNLCLGTGRYPAWCPSQHCMVPQRCGACGGTGNAPDYRGVSESVANMSGDREP